MVVIMEIVSSEFASLNIQTKNTALQHLPGWKEEVSNCKSKEAERMLTVQDLDGTEKQPEGNWFIFSVFFYTAWVETCVH